MNKESKAETMTGLEVAIIGMSGRFPGADNITCFRENLGNGVEAISFFSRNELEEWGIDAASVAKPAYVPAMGVLEQADYFDSSFFDYTPVEAETMDPQTRIFHECAWEAMEDAGYDPGAYDGSIGVYAGGSPNMNWEVLSVLSEKGKVLGEFAARQLSRKDYLSTLVSYRFNLRGPAVAIYTACSTSLVAIHMAAQALINGECDMALAGGVTVSFPSRSGYHYQEGMVMSADGHCRAFDKRSSGIVGGNGAGIVMVKMLEDAVVQGDHIYAVIKGSAINNDGTRKLGFSAPSVEGQAQAVRSAIQMAEIDPETITYVETHGTGTRMGDPVEIEGLKLAFNTEKTGYCGIGSVKTNLGHLDSAAGAAGLIKTVLALYHRLIPASLHIENPDPEINFENSPFYVVSKPVEWKRQNGPLRAGVSSLGIGGTNAHVILEEWSQPIDSNSHTSLEINGKKREREYQLILLSARTPSALNTMGQNLANYLGANPGINLGDAAYTLALGRKTFEYKRFAVCAPVQELRQRLEVSLGPEPTSEIQEPATGEDDIPVIFMFSGQGSQYVNMGWNLYRQEPVFREEMDRCFNVLESITGYPVRHILYPGMPKDEKALAAVPGDENLTIDHVLISGPIKFIFDYSLARLLMHWGIVPDAMIGHSFGEYTAARLAGVFSLEDALELVVLRGVLMRKTPDGAMLSVPLGEEQLQSFLTLAAADTISIAAVNTDTRCIVSGPLRAIEAFNSQLKEAGHEGMFLNFPRAAHSAMMEPICPEFEEKFRQINVHSPDIPYISGLTGRWITAEQTKDPQYWSGHLQQTIRFLDSSTELLKKKKAIFIQVGSDRGLPLFISQHRDFGAGHCTMNLLRHQKEDISDTAYILDKLGQLWLKGKSPHWQHFYSSYQGRRVSLPTYPFERKHYPVETGWLKAAADGSGKELSFHDPVNREIHMADWFYIPTWQQSGFSHLFSLEDKDKEAPPCNWLIFNDHWGLGTGLAAKLEARGHHVHQVQAGVDFELDDYKTLLDQLADKGESPRQIVHLWGITGDADQPGYFLDRGFYSLVYLARALGMQEYDSPVSITVITDNMHSVTGEEKIYPVKAAVLGPVKVIPLEYPDIRCRSIDVVLPANGGAEHTRLVDQVLGELNTGSSPGEVMALRGNYRWEQSFKPLRLPPSGKWQQRLREQGVYLITGGLGGIGLVMAQHLVKTVNARLVLIGRTALPPQNQWKTWLSLHEKEKENPTSSRIRGLLKLQAIGAEFLIITADVSDRQQMASAIASALSRFGTINGVIHCAGLPDGAVIPRRSKEISEPVLAPKVKGTLVLEQVLKDVDLDFLVLCSSNNAIIPAVGQAGHCGANAFLDAYAYHRVSQGKPLTISINWNAWQEVGQAAEFSRKLKDNLGLSIEKGLKSDEGVEVFNRILGENLPQVIVSTENFPLKIQRVQKAQSSRTGSAHQSSGSDIDLTDDLTARKSPARLHPRPQLKSHYTPPRNEIEKKIVRIWQEFFGYDRVGIHDDFFALGGDSLKALIISGKIHKALDTKIPVAEIFNKPTISELSAFTRKYTKKNIYAAIPPIEKKDYYPLSSAQERMFFLNQLDNSSIAYNLPRVLAIEGNLDTQQLEQTFRVLLQRHQGLKTSFVLINDQPVQKIHPHAELQIEYYDLPPAGTSNNQEQEQAVPGMIKEFIRPFDLSRPPLLRVGLSNLAKEKYLLIIDMHHIIADGASIQSLIHEFTSIYNGSALSQLKLHYHDFSQWQFQLKESGAIADQEKFWLDQFQDEIPVLEMPIDFPRPQVQAFTGNSIGFELPGKTLEKAKKITAQTGSTLFMLLLAVYNVLLSKYTGQDDIIVGSPVSGRTHPDLQQVMGMFVNMLAMRNQPLPNKSFSHFLIDVKSNALEAYENQDYPFETLVNQLGLKKDLSRNPLFDTVFLLRSVDDDDSSGDTEAKKIGNLKLKPYPFAANIAAFDLRVYAVVTNDKIQVTMEYAASLFKKSSLEKFCQRYVKILDQVLLNPDLHLTEIDVLLPGEKELLLFDFNDTKSDYPGNKNLQMLLNEQVERIPDHAALKGPKLQVTNYKPGWQAQLSYKEIHEKSNQLALCLLEKGVKKDEIVAIMVDRSVEMIIGILSILKAGAAYLPIDPEYPIERMNYMLADSSTKILVTTTAPDKEIKKNLEIIFIDSFAVSNFSTPQRLNFSASRPANLAYVIYTSGTTGNPKGVLIEHNNVVNLLVNNRFPFDFNNSDVWTMFHSSCFDFSAWEMFGALTYGGVLIIVPRIIARDTPQFRDLLIDYGVTILNQTPSAFYNLLHEELNFNKKRLTLRCVIFGGEALKPGKLKNWQKKYPHTRLVNMFGITETCIHTTYKEIGPEEIKADVNSIGIPLPNTSLFVLDKNQCPVPPNIPGELYVSGNGLARGYLNHPVLTGEKFRLRRPGALFIKTAPGPRQNFLLKGSVGIPQSIRLYRSGDMVRLSLEVPGNSPDMEYLGRIDQQVQIRGYRIEPGEIENQLLKYEGIRDAVVVPGSNRDNHHLLCAYITAAATAPAIQLTTKALRNFLADKLPDYMLPDYFVVLNTLPLTPNGKIDYKALPPPDIKDIKGKNNFASPGNKTEQQLVDIWAEILLLPRENISIDDNFFESGGHSLNAIMMLSKIHTSLEVKIPLAALFKYPSIRELALYILPLAHSKSLPLNPVEKKEFYPLTPAQKRLYITQHMDLQSSYYNISLMTVVAGKPKKDRIKKTFKKLMARHESLRTSFPMLKDEPVQKICHKPPAVPITYYQQKPNSPLTTGKIIADFIKPFDLSRAPLLRIGIVPLSAHQLQQNSPDNPQQKNPGNEYLLMLDMHHIISDGTSTEILAEEFFALYDEKSLPHLSIQYHDYSQWLNCRQMKEKIQQQKKFWLQHFAGDIPLLHLPLDFPRPDQRNFLGHTLIFEINRESKQALSELATQKETTLFILLLAIFYVFLAKISGQEDIIAGTAVTGRYHPEFQRIIGVFVNTLALRNQPNRKKSFEQFLTEVNSRTLEAFENQDYPFEELVMQVLPNRDPGRSPLFDVGFGLQTRESREIESTQLKLRPYYYENKISKFDLNFIGRETQDKLVFTVEYSTSLFKKHTVENFIDCFLETISTVLAHPGKTIEDINIRAETGKTSIPAAMETGEELIPIEFDL